MENYDITDYLKDDKELQKAVIEELLKELSTQQGKLDAFQMSENEANEIIAELKAENFELKESLKCFQTPEAIKALTFYKTGEFELQEKKCIELEQENARLKEENVKLLFGKGTLVEFCNKLTQIIGNHIENKFKTDNFFFATLYSFFKCPRMLNKLWTTKNNCKVRYQTDKTSFGEVFIEESEE